MVRFGGCKNWLTAENLRYAEICKDHVPKLAKFTKFSCRENFMFYSKLIYSMVNMAK